MTTVNRSAAAGLALAVVALGLGVGVASSAPRARGTRISAAEERQVEAILADARVTRSAAVAYFDTEGGAVRHAREIDQLVAGSVRARLVDLLGPERAAAVARAHLGRR